MAKGRRRSSRSRSRHSRSSSTSGFRYRSRARSRARTARRPSKPSRHAKRSRSRSSQSRGRRRPVTPPRTLPPKRDTEEVSESSFDSGTSFQSDKSKPKMGVLYWGGGLEGQGWDLSGRARGGFPRIDRYSDALVDSWKGRMENAQVTLRMCASEGPGFKRYMKHFMMLSSQACVEFRLKQYHRYNTVNRRKVLTERQVIGGILDCWNRTTANSGNSGMRISNGGPGEPSFIAFLRRRARRYRAQAHKLGGHFAAVILEGGQEELKFVAAARTLSAERKSSIKRVLLILGGPDGIPGGIRQEMRLALEEYTDFPLLGLALPGGILHSYYALATVLVFHDQGLLIPYLEFHVGKPRQVVKPKARPPTRQGEIHEMPRSANSEDPTIPKVPEPSEPSEPREAPPRPPTNITNITNITNLTNGLGACTPKPKPPSCPPPAHLLAQRPRLPDQPPERVFDGPFFAGPQLAAPGLKAPPVRTPAMPAVIPPFGIFGLHAQTKMPLPRHVVEFQHGLAHGIAMSGSPAICDWFAPRHVSALRFWRDLGCVPRLRA